MSSLIPERPLIISPSLATTIGLEEAVLLQVLNDAKTFTHSVIKNHFSWTTLSSDELTKLLPFWDTATLQKISESLKEKGIILIDSSPLTQSNTLCFAMNENIAQPAQDTAQQPDSQSPTRSQVPAPATRIATSINASPRATNNTTANTPTRNHGATLLANDWQPNEDLLQLLALNHGIPRDFALKQCEDFILYWRDRRQVSHSWSSKFRQHVLKEWRFEQSRQAKSTATNAVTSSIQNTWQPSPDALEILQRTDINREFIEDAIPEFVLYWSERGEACNTWNSKFIAHIRRQWAVYTKTMELDYEPREIAANWQPSEDVYDILKLANIDLSFARQLVPEFVLFWRDTKQIQRSWNTKFLQHAKYHWATRHQMNNHYSGQNYARQQVPNRPGQTERKTTFEHLTDRSWAQDLVDGS
jgi:hypothetical protein